MTLIIRVHADVGLVRCVTNLEKHLSDTKDELHEQFEKLKTKVGLFGGCQLMRVCQIQTVAIQLLDIADKHALKSGRHMDAMVAAAVQLATLRYTLAY